MRCRPGDGYGDAAAARLLWRAAWFACAAGAAAACYAQSGWKPEKNVEIIVGTTPGGGQDRTARVIQRIVQEKSMVDVPVAVVNRPGGGGAVAPAYSHQRKGDGHFLQIA